MVRINNPIIRTFTKMIHSEIRPCRIFLFGSRAKGTARKNSDYDFLLISPKFRRQEWEKRTARIYQLKKNIPAAMDIICLTPKEFEKKSKELSIVQEAVREGVELA